MDPRIQKIIDGRKQIADRVKEIDEQINTRGPLVRQYEKLGKQALRIQAAELVGQRVNLHREIPGTLVETWRHVGLVRVDDSHGGEECIESLEAITPIDAERPEPSPENFLDRLPTCPLSSDSDFPF